ncbi:hypothetical protein DUNSADRAFT_9451 [Dunaliella salina]|nr:hypothetical protein DUNSADRAFT_9451 [Dunaliella salina]|eukprot:KAF5834014.1 hypothetical protein DUNSADRAFT_9451 [Dunaliella salina]
MLVASAGSIAVRRNADAWTAPAAGHARYAACLPVLPDPKLCALVLEEAQKEVGPERVVQGLNASADSFYSSQGRTNSDFDDENESLLQQLCANHPELISLEMETFQLLDLARCAKGSSILGMSMCIALAERYSNRFMDYKSLEAAELAGGRAALSALARVQLKDDQSLAAMNNLESKMQPVWA